MAQSNIILEKPTSGEVNSYTIPEGDSARISFEPTEIDSMELASNGHLIITFEGAGEIHITNFEEFLEDGNLLYLADGTLIDPATLGTAVHDHAHDMNGIETAAGDATITTTNTDAEAQAISKPGANTKQEVSIESGQKYVCDFDPSSAKVEMNEDGQMVLTFADGSQILVNNYTEAMAADVPAELTLEDGNVIDTEELLTTVTDIQAPVEEVLEVANIEPAAGEPAAEQVANIEPAAGGDDIAAALNQIETAAGGDTLGGRGGTGFNSTTDDARFGSADAIGAINETALEYVAPQFTTEQVIIDSRPDVSFAQANLDETSLVNGNLAVSGNLPVDFGNDGPGSIAPTGNANATCSVANDVLSSGGQPVIINSVPGGYQGVLSDGTVVFDFAINNAGNYTYEQYETIDHADSTDPDDVICLNFGVVATDRDGDTVVTTVRVNVRDDAPTVLSQTPALVDETDAVNGQLTATGQFNADLGQDVTDGAYSGNNNFSATGSVDNGTLTSNGSPVTVVFDGNTNTFTGTDGNGDTVFTLELNPDTGAYEYTQLAPLDHADDTDTNDVLTLNFGVDVTDYDGDTASGQISIQVFDDAPTVADAVNTVDETNGTDTVTGTLNVDFGQDGAGSVSPSDSFTPDGSLANGALTSNGSPVTVTQTADGYVGTDGNGDTVFTMTIDAATGEYTFTQILPLDHADGTDSNDAITLNFGVNVSDYEGDTVGANITITVLDDGPVVVDAANSVDETDLTANGLVVNGSVNIDGGEDGLVSVGPSNNFTPGGSLAGGSLTSNGVAVVVTQTANGYVGTANGQTVFTMEIDPTTGDYTFTQNGPLDHADGTDPNDAITLDFGIVATDGDGDTGEGSITITVRDDAPVAHDDVNEFDVADGSTTGNVITGENGGPGAADDLSNDAANTVTQVEAPDGTIVQVPATGTVDVEGEFGTLTIASDGSYTYTLDPNVIGGPGGTGSLDPAAADFAGFQSTFMNEGITITANNGQDLSWVSTTNVGSGIGITGNGTNKVFGANEQLEISLADGADTVAITLADLGANNVGDTFSMDVFLASDPTTPVRVEYTVGNNPDGTQTFDINAADFGPGAQIIGVNLVGGVSYLLADVDVNYAGEPVHDEFIYTIQDGDGDTSNATLTFEGNPSPIGIIGIGSVDETDFVNGQGTESGDIHVNYQGDGQGTTTAEGTFTPGGSLANNALTANGLPVIVTLVGNTYTGTAGGETVFTMTINADATYDYAQFAPIDHADGTDPNDAITLDFGVIATDSDGDAGEGTVTITVFDDAPVANDDTITVGEDDTGTGNVITNNDNQGEDTDATVTSVNFEGTDYDVPANGTVTVEGNSGTLTIGSNGDYTYEANGTPSETIRTFEVIDPVGGAGAGNIEAVSGSYNETTEELNFSFTVAGSDANGYTLVLNNGGNPKGHAGELAQFYFDNSGAEPVISVYGYNGLGGVPGTTDSAFDGSQADGIQTPDRIATSLGADSPFSNIVVTTDANGNQTFSFTMDATDLNDHSPLHSVAGSEWNGVQFGDEVGAWFHPVTGLETSYNADGYLTQFDYDARGGWDSSSVPTNTQNVFGDDQFTYTITDSDGDTSTANLNVGIDADVGPTGIYGENFSDDTNVNADGSDVVNGDIAVNYNGDDAGTTTANGDFTVGGHNLPNGELTHEGTPVVVSFDAATNTYTGKAGNVTVFTMEIKPDATYTFTQLASIDHANTAARNETIFMQFGVTATDADGDTGTGMVQIRVLDDWSNAVNDTTSVTEGNFATGNILANDVFGADAPTTLTTVEFDGTTYDVPATGTVTVEGTYGTLILDANGDYTYTPKGNNPQGVDDFNYTIVDGDGDKDTARFRVNVSSQDDVPVITAETDSVDETFGESTVDGTITVDFGSDGPGTLSGSNEFSATGSTGPALTSCGEPVVVTYDAQTGTYTGTSHGDTIFTMTIDSAGSYSFTLLGALDHADQTDPNDAIQLNFGVQAVDSDGSVGTTNVVITVLDDAPEISKDSTRLDETDLANGPLVGGDTLVVDYGQDGAGEVSANGRFEVLHEVGGAPQPLTSGGQPVVVTNTATGYTGTVAGQVAFTLTLNPTTAEYVYTQYMSLDHPDGEAADDVMWLKFYVDATDKDGDVDTTFINIDIHDDAPEANNDTGVVGEGGTVGGNVLDNDEVGADDPGMVCGVTFNGQTVAVPATGTVQVTGSYGVLTIAANGTYSYTAHNNNPDGTDTFTYEMKDEDGDTDTATLSISVTPDNDVPVIITPATQTVDDTDLENGNNVVSGQINVNYGNDAPGEVNPNGDFSTMGNDGGQLTSCGEPVVVTVSGNTYTGTANGEVVFTMEVRENGSYTFTQLGALDHSNTNSHNEQLLLKFGATATDGDGDSASTTVTIRVLDDGPEIATSVTGVNEINLRDNGGPLVVNKTFDHDFGQDGAGSFKVNGTTAVKFKVGGQDQTLQSDGKDVVITATGTNGYVGKAGNVTVFTLELNETTGEYTYKQFAAVDHPGVDATGTNDVIWLKLGVTIMDKDGDSADAYVNIDIRDDAPEANNDTGTVTEGGTTSGNVLTNDEEGADGQAMVCAVRFNGQTVDVPATGTVSVDGAYGVLTIAANGTYSYVANTNNPDGKDVFTYTMKDADGDTSMANLSIDVTSVNDVPTITNSVFPVSEADLCHGGISVTKTINHDFGDDGKGSIEPNGTVMTLFQVGGNNQTLTSDGKEVVITQTNDGYVGKVGNTTVFNLDINPSTGKYTYTQHEAVDHPGVGAEGTQDVIWLKFGVTITDSDGDTANGFVQVDIRDSAPTAIDDSSIVKPNGVNETYEMNLTSADVAGTQSSITKDGITIKSNNGHDLRWVNAHDGSSGVGIAGNGSDVVWSGGEEMHVRFNGGVTGATVSIGEVANNIGNTITYTVLLANGTSVHESIKLTNSNVSNGVVDIDISGYSAPITGVNVTGGASYILNDVSAENVVTTGGEATGNVLANDHICAEGGNVTSVKFGNNVVEVPENGSSTINGANGTLTINSDGSYSYESNNTASQTVHTFSIDNPPGSDAAGDIKNVSTSYNETTRDFTFSMTVEPSANGIEFAVNNGPNPKNHPGELAFFYVDDSGAEPVVTVYAYNGSSVHSWKDGSSEAGNQPADKILSSLTNPEAFSDISVTVDANGNKTFSISLDVTEIQNHNPAYGPDGIWEGVNFGDKVGIWSHPLSGLETEYGNDGFLTEFDYDHLGWYDSSNQEAHATVIPGTTGSDSFTYTITDADGDTDTATLNINGDANAILIVENTDQYFGTNEADAFLFQAINDSAVTIHDFNTAEGDCLDLSAVLENYDETTDAINDFVYTTQSGGNTVVSVDADGVGGAPAQQVAVLEGVTGLSAADLIDNGNLVT